MTTEHGLEQFTEYFVRNYPGPDTVIFDPKWHAPKIFHAAISAYLSALAPQAGDNAEEPVAVLDDLHSVMCLLETLSEAMPADDVSAVMMSVMANNIRQKHFGGTDAIASHPCTSTPVVSQNAPEKQP
ncbi:hypothetical protein EVC28_033 [Rhizobium phage RHph_I1_23]|nr:hypothetical protein EVC28_033 [Rhizobium phage RHph_I1_23]